jgi:hypothetical protein
MVMNDSLPEDFLARICCTQKLTNFFRGIWKWDKLSSLEKMKQLLCPWVLCSYLVEHPKIAQLV